MTIWIVFALMTLAAMAILLIPVLRREPREAAPRGDYDRAVFRDQLAELDRDLARGAIAPAEAAAARNEISRRLLQASAAPGGRAPAGSLRVVALLGALVLPAVAVPVYLERGSPGLPDVPLAQRLDRAVENKDFEALIAKVERHLAEQPGDVEGWKVLAPAYRNAQRWGDSADAFATILKLEAPTAAMLADYGEMLVFANQGMVTADAHDAFAEALGLDPKLPKARFYDGVALKQEGKRDQARAVLQAFRAESPADATWRTALDAELRDLDGTAPALTDEQLAEGADMSAADRQTMIRSMVDGLEARLKSDADDIDGWQRLIRARTVLNEPDKAKAALASARARFKDRPEALAALDGLARELGI